jgi:hypothetical protein
VFQPIVKTMGDQEDSEWLFRLMLIFYTIVSEVIDYQHVAVLKMA